MATEYAGRFGDDEIERRFQHAERRARLPFVRIYAGVATAVILAYALANPFFFTIEDELRFMILLVPALLCLGGYFAATFWPGYLDRPMIDFAALLALAVLLMGDNILLFEELTGKDHARHASIAIDGLIVSAFAAIALTGNRRLFLAWLVLQTAAFIAMLLWFDATLEGRVYGLLSYATGAAVMLFINWALDRVHRTSFGLRLALDAERAKTEELLYNVLPEAAAQRLKDGQIVADSFSDASVVFIDVVGFSTLAKTVSPGHLVEVLNAFFSLADRCAAEHGVEKVKTIGDAYLAISGGNAPARNSADSALAFAGAVIEGLGEVRAAAGLDIEVRVGIHSGPVVGGVIGATRMAYDYWGETMNIASRIEGVAAPNGIAVSESTYLRARGTRDFEPAETVVLKGVGEMAVYRLSRKDGDPPQG